ncbi:hypothetical protein V6N11_020765 [Hibiscus sabdariffa]|uniref:RNase H type-1 domain-containing protein n=1 Tax=Hibiscus sabdariffa TaxID=183260 RepID=A0ABR2Q9C5_9ROSI
MLPREKLDLIASVQTPQSGVGMDTSGWSGEDKRLISTRSAYDFLFQGSELGDTVIWKRIWKLETVQIVTSCSDVLKSSALVGSILRFLGEDWSVAVNHIGRGSNNVVDRLAKQGRGLSLDSTLFPMVPVDIACFVEKEQRDSSPVTTSPSIIEQAVPFDLGGSD